MAPLLQMTRYAGTALGLWLAILLPAAVMGFEEPKEQLWQAARKGDLQAIKDALKQGADVNAKTPYGVTALHFAADKGHAEVVKLLLENKAKVNEKDTFYGTTPITWASSHNHVAVVEALLGAGATGGQSILLGAIREGNVAMTKVVIEKTKPNELALSAALMFAEKPEIVDLLKKAGGKVAEKPKDSKIDFSRFAGTFKNAETGDIVLKPSAASGLDVEAGGRKVLHLNADKGDVFKAEGSPITVAFQSEDGKISGLTLKMDQQPDRIYQKADPSAAAASTPPKAAKVFPDPQPVVKNPANWPQFRGMGAKGVSDGQFPPTNFDVSKGKNVRWKTAIAGLGHSCPVIWDNKVFVTTAIGKADATLRPGQYGDVDSVKEKEPHTWQIICLDKQTGSVLWNQTVCTGVPKLKRHLKGTHANPTPATDGKHLIVSFGAEGLFCYDLDGKQLWKKDLGRLDSGWFFDPDYQWGFGSSPVIHKNKAIVQCDAGKNSFMAAYSLTDGSELWKVARDVVPSWGTPTVVEGPARDELVANGTKHAMGYDPETGKELWRVGRLSEITVPTPFSAHGLIYICSGYSPIQPIYAVKMGAKGDITPAAGATTSEGLAWSLKAGGPYMPTPLVYEDHLYVLANSGLLTCYDAKTGKKIYAERIGGSSGYTAAPVAADGRLYCVSETHGVRVVKTGPKYELMAINPIGETCMATPAIADGMLFVRTEKNLIALGLPKPSSSR